jgi:hypothetical protein
MLTNPLVMINLETGRPWNDSEIARRCCVSIRTVGRHRADLAAEQASQAIIDNVKDTERAVTRGGKTYTMNTANIGTKTEPATKADGLSASEAKTPVVVVPAKVEPAKPEAVPAAPAPLPEPQPEPVQGGEVVQFTSPHDYLYDLLSQIDRTMAALPAPNVVASELPVAHRPELVPTGAQQHRHLPPPGNGLGGVVPVLQGVAVARRRPAPVSPVMHPALPSVPAV